MNNTPCLLGIDVGGTKTAFALVDTQGKIVRQTSIPTQKATAEQWIAILTGTIDSLARQQPVTGIGIGIKGMIAADLQTIIHSSVVKQPCTAGICTAISTRYQVPCIMDNDVHAATKAEIKFGRGRKYSDFVYINLGTGLAAGIVCNGTLIRGSKNLAGELGMTTEIRRDDGHPYSLETAVSGAGLVAEAIRLHSRYPGALSGKIIRQEGICTKDIVQAHKTGDLLADAVMTRFIDTLLRVMENTALLVNPQAFVFGGGLGSDPYVFALLGKEYEARSNPIYRADILLSELGGNETGVIGAASLCLPE